MKKNNNIKNITIIVLALLLCLSLGYICFNKLNVKENTNEKNNITLEAIKWYYDNDKLLDILSNFGFYNFNKNNATIDDYYKFIVHYMEVNGNVEKDETSVILSEKEVKEVLLKYFDINNINEIMNNLKEYQVNDILDVENFYYKNNTFYLKYYPMGYDYEYILDRYESLENEIILELIYTNSYTYEHVGVNKITLENKDNELKIKKMEYTKYEF